MGGFSIILLAAAIATAPILLHGPFCGDDFEFHAVGWFDVQHSWLQGVLYPHWMASANYNAGEPRFMFYPPLTWMLGAALGSVLPWALVPVAMVFLFLAATGLAVRRLAQEQIADAPATLAGCTAIFSGFTLFTAYERTAFAELTGGFWIPLILLFALRDARQSQRSFTASTAPLALLLAGAWLSNGPVGVMGSYTLAALALGAAIWNKSWTPLIRACLATALGIGLAAFSLIPAAWEQRWADLLAAVDYPVFSIENNWLFARHTDALLAPFQMVLHRASWIAMAMIGAALASAAIVRWQQSGGRPGIHLRLHAGKSLPSAPGQQPAQLFRDTSSARWWLFLAAIPAIVFFLQFPISLPIWNLLPKLRFLQYPWRWLLVVEAPLGIFFAAAVWPASARKNWPRITAACLCSVLFLGITAFAARTFLRTCTEGDSIADLEKLYHSGGTEGTDEYEPPGADHWLIAKGLPEACLSLTADAPLGKQSDESQTPDWSPSQGSCVQTFAAAEQGPEHMRLAMDIPRAGFLILRLVRYPAWRITLNGKPPADLPERDDGLIAVPVPQGHVDLQVIWTATPDVYMGRTVTALALGLLLCFAAVQRKRRTAWDKIEKTLHTPHPQTEAHVPASSEDHVKA